MESNIAGLYDLDKVLGKLNVLRHDSRLLIKFEIVLEVAVKTEK